MGKLKNRRKLRKQAKTIVQSENFRVSERDLSLPNFKEKILLFWPVIDAVLMIVQFFLTMAGKDIKHSVVGKLAEIGEHITDPGSTDSDFAEFFIRFGEIVDDISTFLQMIKLIVPDRVDDVIDEFIALGELAKGNSLKTI